jgi:trimeric autotransporter adhesin
MKKTSLLALCAVAVAVALCAQAQEIDIIRSDGQVNQFSVADIDSITFGVHAGKAASVLSEGLRGVNDILRIHTEDGMSLFPVAGIDSVCFASDNVMTIYQGAVVTGQFNLADVDSLTFASSTANAVSITYDNATATVVNPFEAAGVTVTVAGADVTVAAAAGLPGIAYQLSGTTANGMCKIYSDSDFTLRLNGVQITNPDGPAINIQADEEITVELAAGTTNVVTDGPTYAAAPPGEDQKAAFFSEGQLIFTGSGSLTVHGLGTGQHGLGSDDYVVVEGGSVVVASAVKDGIHTNEGYYMQGGSVSVTSTSDGVDAGDGPVEILGGNLTVLNPADDKDALKCVGDLGIAGGVVNLTVDGDQAKGLNAANINLTGGTVTIHTSGGVVLEASGVGFDPSYCTAVKADNLVLLDGCQLTIVTSGLAGRGISCDGDIQVQSGSVSVTSSGGGGAYTDPTGVLDAYHGPCLSADRNLVLSGGTMTLSHSGSAGKGIAGDANLTIGTATTTPTLQITTSGGRVSIGGGEYAEAKAVSVDSVVTINSGQLTISSSDDAIKSKYRLVVNGGLINITHSVEGLESPNLYLNGGEVRITSSDDGINATYGNDIEGNDGSILNITGSYVYVNAPTGDGIDSNGNLTISGGTVVVHGPPSQPEVGLDVNGTFLMNGSFTVVAQINSNMVESPSNASSQRSVLLRRTQTLAGGTLFHIEDASGNSLVTFAPARTYSCILLSTANLVAGTTYRVYTGGTCTGTVHDGVYSGGTYSGGTLRATFTSSGVVQAVTF